jgi:site-specific recombinase XerD
VITPQIAEETTTKNSENETLAGPPWLLMEEILVVARTSGLCYVESMDEVLDGGAQLTLVATDDPTLEEAFSAFCQVYMPGRNFTAATRRGYRYDLAEWFSHVAVSHVKALSTRSIKRYLAILDEKGLKDATRQRKLAAITTFLRFLEEQHMLPNDLSSNLVWPKGERGELRPLRTAQYTALLREAATNPRDLAMFAMLLQTGIRLSELTGLTLESITLPKEPSVDRITGYGLLRIRRSGRRLSELVVNYKAARAIQAYLAVRPGSPSQALFLNKYGKPSSNLRGPHHNHLMVNQRGDSNSHPNTDLHSNHHTGNRYMVSLLGTSNSPHHDHQRSTIRNIPTTSRSSRTDQWCRCPIHRFRHLSLDLGSRKRNAALGSGYSLPLVFSSCFRCV